VTSRRKGQVEALRVNIHEAKETNFLPFLSKGKHRSITTPSREVYFITVLNLLLACAFML
jgi:hypothetical protein